MTVAVIDADYKTKTGYTFKIVEYRSAKEVLIQFQDRYGAILSVEASQIKRGNIVNPYEPRTIGVGFIGQGEYKSRLNPKEMTKSYRHWFSMLNRCYGKNVKGSYSDCKVAEEWFNYQIFAEWVEKQVGFENEEWHLDKDLLVKNNKLYSKEVCVFLPQEINNFTNKRKSLRGSCVIGVCFDKSKGKYISQGNFKGFAPKFIGAFSTEIEAFNAYKNQKESHAKFLANKYKSIVDERVIDALNNFKVEITD